MEFRSLPLSAGLIYEIIFWIACAVWIVPEIVASRTSRSPENSQSADRGSLKVVAMLWVAGITLAVLLSMFLQQTNFVRGRIPLLVSGICLMISGTLFRWYSAWVLGRYFTFDVSIQSGHSLVESGPYRYIRHPSYTGALVSLLGFGLALGNWASVIASVSSLGVAYLYRIPIEEAALKTSLGEAYSRYMERTWRLLPFVF